MSEEKKKIEQSPDMAAEPVGTAMRSDVDHGTLICFKDNTGNGSRQSRLPFFRPSPSLIPLCKGKKDKKVGEKNENLFSFPSLNRNFALSFRLARRYFRSLT